MLQIRALPEYQRNGIVDGNVLGIRVDKQSVQRVGVLRISRAARVV